MSNWRVTIDFEAGPTITEALDVASAIKIPGNFRSDVDSKIDLLNITETTASFDTQGNGPRTITFRRTAE